MIVVRSLPWTLTLESAVVTQQVFLQVIFPIKCLATLGAHLTLAARVNNHVSSQMFVTFEGFAAHVTTVRSVLVVT